MTPALVLSGGGARAAYQAGVLLAVTEIVPHSSGNLFPIICGTSAGAINAAALACGADNFRQSTEQLAQLWRQLTVDQVIRTEWSDILGGFGRIAGSFFNQGVGKGRPLSLLDNAPLRNLLHKHIHFDRLAQCIDSGQLRAVSATAMAYSSGESISFFQGHPSIGAWRRYHRVGTPTRLTVEHLLASSALPGIFPTIKLGRDYYGDGAVRQLSPLGTAMHLGADKIFVVGVSNNRNPDHWGKHSVVRHSPSLGQVLGHLLNSAFLDSLDSDLEHLDHVNDLLNAMPEEHRKAMVGLKNIEALVISPTKPVDKIAGRCVRYLPSSLRFLMRSTGSTAKGGGATMASYLMFNERFCNELIELGYQDAMWDRDNILRFFEA